MYQHICTVALPWVVQRLILDTAKNSAHGRACCRRYLTMGCGLRVRVSGSRLLPFSRSARVCARAMAFAPRRSRRKTPLRDATKRLSVEAPLELGAEDPAANMRCETHLLTIRGDAFAEVCWCLSERDASSVAASAKVLNIELGDASMRR